MSAENEDDYDDVTTRQLLLQCDDSCNDGDPIMHVDGLAEAVAETGRAAMCPNFDFSPAPCCDNPL
jgi:hypothetical protein